MDRAGEARQRVRDAVDRLLPQDDRVARAQLLAARGDQRALTGPAAEALLFGRADADAWRERLQTGTPLAPPPVPASIGFALTPGTTQEQRVPLPPGQYMMVIDNSSRIGRVNPPWNPLNAVGANPVVLSYRLELGETP